MKSTAKLRRSARHSNPAADFVAGNHRGKKTLTINMPDFTDQCVGSRNRLRSRMNNTDPVKIVHLKTMNQGAIRERRTGTGNLTAISPDERSFSLPQLFDESSD